MWKPGHQVGVGLDIEIAAEQCLVDTESWLPLRNWLPASSRDVFPLAALSLGQDSVFDTERAARDGFVSRSEGESSSIRSG